MRHSISYASLCTVLTAFLASGCETYPFRAELNFDKTAEIDGINKVEVRTRNGHISVNCADELTEATIDGIKFARGTTEEEALEYAEKVAISAARSTEDPSVLKIAALFPEGARGRSLGAHLNLILPRDVELDLGSQNGKVEVEGAKALVRISTSNGAIEVAEITGRIEAVTSNGKIKAKNIKGDLELRSSNGKIQLENVGQRTVRAETSNGTITAHDLVGEAFLKTSNGSIDLSATSIPDSPNVVAKTSNGSVRVELPATVKAVLDMKTSNGKIHTELNGARVEDMEAGKRHVHARLNGGGGSITIETRNGSVTFKTVK